MKNCYFCILFKVFVFEPMCVMVNYALLFSDIKRIFHEGHTRARLFPRDICLLSPIGRKQRARREIRWF